MSTPKLTRRTFLGTAGAAVLVNPCAGIDSLTATRKKLAVVTNYGARDPGHSLSVVDLAAQKEIHRVDLGALGRPHGILFADNQFYFTAELNKLIARYDPATNKLDWLLGVGQNRTHMLVRTKYLNEFFTSNVDSGTVTAIEKSSDPSGWKETNIPVGKAVEGIDILPDDMGDRSTSASTPLC